MTFLAIFRTHVQPQHTIAQHRDRPCCCGTGSNISKRYHRHNIVFVYKLGSNNTSIYTIVFRCESKICWLLGAGHLRVYTNKYMLRHDYILRPMPNIYKLLCNVDNLGSIKKLPRLSHRRKLYRFNIKRWNGSFHLLYDRRSQIIYLNLCFWLSLLGCWSAIVRLVRDNFEDVWMMNSSFVGRAVMKQFAVHYSFVYFWCSFHSAFNNK